MWSNPRSERDPAARPRSSRRRSTLTFVLLVPVAVAVAVPILPAAADRPQTIQFTSTPPAPAFVGDVYHATTTVGGSSAPVVISIDDTSTAGCAASATTMGTGADGQQEASADITFISAGSCVIDANQAGDDDNEDAPQVQQSVDVSPAPQSITFESVPPAGAHPHDGGYVVAAWSDAQNYPVDFSIEPGAETVCALAGPTTSALDASGHLVFSAPVAFTAVGSCLIDATNPGDSYYQPASAQQGVQVTPWDQVITFTSTPPANATVGATYQATATGGASGQPVVFSADPASAGICTVTTSGAVSLTGAGSCLIDADQAGTADYAPAPTAQQTVSVAPGRQAIQYTSVQPVPAYPGDTYTVQATGGPSGQPVIFSQASSSGPGVCTVSAAGQVAFTAAGECVIAANQAGDQNYLPAHEIRQTVLVYFVKQRIAFTSTPPAQPISGKTYQAAATGGGSGNPVVFSDSTADASVCTVSSSGLVSFVGPGTCEVLADQAGNAQYSAAPTAKQAMHVVAPQMITFTSTPPTHAVAGGRYQATATGGGSGNPVVFSATRADGGICSVASDGVVTLLGTGTCTVVANQAGNADYLSAKAVRQAFRVYAKRGG